MNTHTATTRSASAVSDGAQRARRNASPWIERLARLGYAAKGVTYLLIGLLAVQAALGDGGRVGGARDALSRLEGEGGFGTVLLWVVGIGIAGYALWSLFRAAFDPEGEGSDAKGIAKRAFYVISGVIHAALAVWIYTHLLSDNRGGGGGGGGGSQGMIERGLAWGTTGRLLIAAIGAGIIAFGVQQLIKAWRVDLDDQLNLAPMGGSARQATIAIARFGTAARGVVFAMLGWLLLMAAWHARSGEAGGVDEAMDKLSTYGPWVLGITALGMAAYGIYMFVKARYRRINP